MVVQNQKAQSAVEYILLVTAVVVVLIAVVTRQGPFGQVVSKVLNQPREMLKNSMLQVESVKEPAGDTK